ncbi:MAG: DNA polymerase III subunit gamma/tau [candidate division WOR-3 bacterium]|jgi:DNA polymerase-3 subunit gamma/tau
MSLAVKYRPKNFDDHIGQEHIVKALRKALREKRIAPAYLFSGPRGVGKTTTARILAKALNCDSYKDITDNPCGICNSCRDIENSRHIDVIEIDGASNRGIDEVRQIRENIKFLPSRGRYKVYIIDEVHMLTIEAFNALLKTLEEPPNYILFIFATTDPQKIPPTVLSRLQRYDFKPISTFEIIQRLNKIIQLENIKIEEKAIEEIARRAEGSLRDAIVLLDQMNMFCEEKITYNDVLNILGAIQRELLEELLKEIYAGNLKKALTILNIILEKNVSILDFVREFNEFLFEVFKEVVEGKRRNYSKEDLMIFLNIALEMESSIRYSITPKVWLEFFISKMCYVPRTIQIMEILENYNIIYEKQEKKKQEETKQPITLKDKLIDYFDQNQPIISGIISDAEIKEEDGKIKFIFSNKYLLEEVNKYLENIKNALNKLNYQYKEIEILTKEENPLKQKLISELNLIKVKDE